MTYLYLSGGSMPLLCRCADCKQDIIDDFMVKSGFWYEEVARRMTVCVICRHPGCPAAVTCRGVQCRNTRASTLTQRQEVPSPYPLTIPEDR